MPSKYSWARTCSTRLVCVFESNTSNVTFLQSNAIYWYSFEQSGRDRDHKWLDWAHAQIYFVVNIFDYDFSVRVQFVGFILLLLFSFLAKTNLSLVFGNSITRKNLEDHSIVNSELNCNFLFSLFYMYTALNGGLVERLQFILRNGGL